MYRRITAIRVFAHPIVAVCADKPAPPPPSPPPPPPCWENRLIVTTEGLYIPSSSDVAANTPNSCALSRHSRDILRSGVQGVYALKVIDVLKILISRRRQNLLLPPWPRLPPPVRRIIVNLSDRERVLLIGLDLLFMSFPKQDLDRNSLNEP